MVAQDRRKPTTNKPKRTDPAVSCFMIPEKTGNFVRTIEPKPVKSAAKTTLISTIKMIFGARPMLGFFEFSSQTS